MSDSLRVFHRGRLVFSSNRSWLHPLFDLERVIGTLPADPAELEIHDKIVGAASAFLIVALGVRTLHAGVLSRRGEEVLRRFAVFHTFETLVDRIGCATESLLDPCMDLAAAVAVLHARAAGVKSVVESD